MFDTYVLLLQLALAQPAVIGSRPTDRLRAENGNAY